MTHHIVPTDAELLELADICEIRDVLKNGLVHEAELLDFAGAVLARWGAQDTASALASALGECRDAFAMPPLGSKLELAWQAAIADPLAVPAYVQACLVAPPAPEVREPLTPSQYNIALGCATNIPPSSYEAVTRAIERAHGITAKEPT